MRICLMIEGQEGVTWEQWLALAQAAEGAGLDGLFRSDHYRSIVRGDPAGSLDAWATLAALAARTERIRLGTMVSPVTFRPASVLAKNVVTVDHISDGRVELGIGAGWYESEHAAYGFPFLTTRERLDELDRQLEEIERQWTTADDVWPKPVQQPRPPIIVGGGAKPRTVARRVAVRRRVQHRLRHRSTRRASAAHPRRRPRARRAASRFVLDDDRLRRRPRRRPRSSERLARLAGRHRRATRRRSRNRRPGRRDPARLRGGRRRAGDAAAHAHEDVEMVAVLGEVAAHLG